MKTKTAEEKRNIIIQALLKKLPDKDWFVPNHKIFRGLTPYDHEEIYHEYDQWKNPNETINRFGISSRNFMEFIISQQVAAATEELRKRIQELTEALAEQKRIYFDTWDRLQELRKERFSESVEQCEHYESDNTTAMNCKHCGNPKWTH